MKTRKIARMKYWSVTAFMCVMTVAAYSQSFKFHKTAPGVKMRYIGPGCGGSMYCMAIHPSNPNIMIFGGDMGACYRTENGGKTWEIISGDSFNCPRETWNVRFHPEKNNIAWHLGSGILKSTDAGRTWKNTNAPKGTYCALGLDPDNPDVAYAAEGQAPRNVLHWTYGTVLKTVDGGKTWRKLMLPGGAGKRGSYRNNFTNFIIDPDSKVIMGEGHARVYLFGRGGLFRSENAGKSWKNLSKPFGAGQVNDMVMLKKKGKTALFLSVVPAAGFEKGGVYKSTDNGENWTPANKGLEQVIGKLKTRNKKLKSNPQSSILSLLLAHSKADPDRLYAGSWCGIYRSDNGGDSWYQLAPAQGCRYIKDKNGQYMAIPKKGSHFETSIWGGMDNFNRMIVDQKNADLIAFSDNQDMYLSKNGGKMWDSVSMDYGEAFDKDLYPGTRPNRYTHRVSSRGPQNIVSDQIEIDPFDPKTYYAAYMDIGFQISRDGGKSWEHPTRGTPGRGHAWAVATDPAIKGRIFVTIGQSRGQAGGLYRSEDSGRTWKRIGVDSDEMDKNPVTGKLQSIAIDFNSPVNKRTIYVSSEKNGIYKSADGGDTWKNITSKFSGTAKSVRCVAIDSKSSKTIYAGTNAGLFVSNDAGKSWAQLGKGSFEKVENMSICRTKPSTFYVCAHYPGDNGYWGRAGFWRTVDNGKTFTDITPAYFSYAGAIAVNPFNPDYIYGCNYLINTKTVGQKLKIVRSKNGGKTWENIGDDINCNRGRHLLIDQKDPQKFFILTRFGIIEGRDANAPEK